MLFHAHEPQEVSWGEFPSPRNGRKEEENKSFGSRGKVKRPEWKWEAITLGTIIVITTIMAIVCRSWEDNNNFGVI